MQITTPWEKKLPNHIQAGLETLTGLRLLKRQNQDLIVDPHRGQATAKRTPKTRDLGLAEALPHSREDSPPLRSLAHSEQTTQGQDVTKDN